MAGRLAYYSEASETGCRIWTGGTYSNGYGQMNVNGKSRLVHRLAYEIANGVIPEGLEIDHLCRVRACIDAEHMEAVTPLKNMERAFSPSMVASHANLCFRGHVLSPENTIKVTERKRTCRICTNDRKRRYYAQNREEEQRRARERFHAKKVLSSWSVWARRY